MRRGLKLLDTLILLPGRIELFPDEKGIETLFIQPLHLRPNRYSPMRRGLKRLFKY